ncbi:MAG: hypothetical protein ABSA02_43285 [Trebonia sp.]|jgi:hypothetical protein
MSNPSANNAEAGEISTSRVLAVDDSELEAVRNLAHKCGVRVEQLDASSLEPISTVTLLLFGTVAAISSVIQAVEHIRGGQVIDLRSETQKAIYRTKDLAYGTVVIITADGQLTVRITEPQKTIAKATARLPEIISAAGSSKSADLITAIRAGLGNSAFVEGNDRPSPKG